MPKRADWACRSFADNPDCTLDDLCFACDDRAHALRHPAFDDPECPTCKLRFVQLSPAATPTKTRRFHPLGKPKGDPAWERGIVVDDRGMPLLRSDGHLIRQKEYAEKRSSFEAARRANHNAPPAP